MTPGEGWRPVNAGCRAAVDGEEGVVQGGEGKDAETEIRRGLTVFCNTIAVEDVDNGTAPCGPYRVARFWSLKLRPVAAQRGDEMLRSRAVQIWTLCC